MASKIIIVHTSYPREQVASLFRSQGISKWIFLASDYCMLDDYSRRIGLERVPLGRELQERVKQNKRAFIEFTGSLAKRYEPFGWWLGRISEKNPSASKLLLNLCFIQVALDYAARDDSDFGIICESPAAAALLSRLFSKKGRVVSTHFKPFFSISSRLRKIAYVSGWLAKYHVIKLSRHIAAGRLRKLVRGLAGRLYVIHTWADDNCFLKAGEFKDRYFGTLSDFLVSKGYSVLTIPEVSTTKYDFAAAVGLLEGLNKGNKHFLVKEALLRPSDYAKPLLVYLKRLAWRFKSVTFSGLDVSGLLEEENSLDIIGEEALNYCAVRRLAALKEISHFADTFEYMIQEKAYQMGFREFSPGTLTIGYQHFPLMSNLMCFYYTKEELASFPFPKRIVSCGSAYKAKLAEYYPENMVFIGPAFRYAYMHNLGIRRPGAANARNILLPLPLDISSAIELYQKAVDALGAGPDVTVLVKPHPMTDPAMMGLICPPEEMPANFKIVRNEMKELLSQIGAGVVLASSAAIDIFAAGIPVIRIGRETDIEVDPLDSIDVPVKPVYSREELTAELERTLKDDKVRDISHSMAGDMLPKLFASANEATLAAFL